MRIVAKLTNCSAWIVPCVCVLSASADADDAAADAGADPANEVTDVSELSLEELLNTDVAVASKVKQPYREVPGVITVVTREEIMDSGARDLEDVLRLVPGFSVAVDVQGATNVGVRGHWGHEGKVLLLIDGQQMNETLYSTNQLGNHYPVDQIERIEIIRGPGSAIYGGFAELAVINVITRGADELTGVAVYGRAGLRTDSLGHATISVAAGSRVGPVKLSLSGFLGKGSRSSGDFTDFYGDTYSLEDHSLDPGFVNFGAKYKELSLRLIYDNYRADERDGLGQNETKRVDQSFTGWYGELAYEWKPRGDLRVTPKLNYTRQLPWRVLDQGSSVFYDKTAQRLTGSASASWDITEAINVVGGAAAYVDHASLNQPTVPDTLQTQFGSSDSVRYINEAVFAEGLLKHEIANVTVGARFEHHSQFGNSFVPRAAVTKVAEPFHLKLLYSEAFRAPGFENINLAPDPSTPPVPERTRVFEVEGGMSIDAHNFVAINWFYTRIRNPIVYFLNEDGSEGYQNFPRTATAGVEVDYRLRYKRGYASVSYSFYRAHDNQVPVYAVAGHSNLLLGMPQHKVTLRGAWQPWRGLRVAPSIVANSGPYAIALPGDGMGVGTLTHADPTLIANLFVSYPDLVVKGLEVGVGGYNLLDNDWYYFQPYDGGHAPMQGGTRQLLVRVGYTQPF